jgi:hypothetical protein
MKGTDVGDTGLSAVGLDFPCSVDPFWDLY